MEIIKAGLYVRTSRSEENKNNRCSIKTQIEGLKQYCQEKDYNVIKIYVDEDYSGSNFNRPGFNKIIDDIKKNEINTIIVKDLSRFGRNLYLMGDYLERIFPSLGIRFIAVNDGVDSINGIGDEVIYKNFFNHLYIKDIRSKMMYSIRSKASKVPLSCRKGLILGYTDGENGEWLIDEEEASLVRRIFKEAISGKSYYKIAKDLEADKLMTSSYRKFFKYGDLNNIKHKGIKPNPDYYYKWDCSTIGYILKNRQYTGCIINKCEGIEYVLENHHPAIISIDEFNKAQVEKKSNFSTTNNELKNFVKCKKCGCAMIKSSYGIHKDVYQCTNCKTWIDSQVVEDLIKKEVETNLKERKPSLVGNKLAKEKQKIRDKIINLENDISELIINDAPDDEIVKKSNEIMALKESLKNLNNCKNIYDINGNKLNEDDMKNFKKVAMSLYEKAYFSKNDENVNMELVER